MDNQNTALVKPMPSTTADFISHRVNPKSANIHDAVEEIHLTLFNNETYRELISAVYNSQAVEGSLRADDQEAARLVRDYAKKQGKELVARQNLTTLVNSLKTVLRRYALDRQSRLNWQPHHNEV